MIDHGAGSPLDGEHVDLRRDRLFVGQGSPAVGAALYLSALLPVLGWAIVVSPLLVGMAWRVARRRARWLTIGAHGLHLSSRHRREVVPFAEIASVRSEGAWIAVRLLDGRTRWVPCRHDEEVVDGTVTAIRRRLQWFRYLEATTPASTAADRSALEGLRSALAPRGIASEAPCPR